MKIIRLGFPASEAFFEGAYREINHSAIKNVKSSYFSPI